MKRKVVYKLHFINNIVELVSISVSSFQMSINAFVQGIDLAHLTASAHASSHGRLTTLSKARFFVHFNLLL